MDALKKIRQEKQEGENKNLLGSADSLENDIAGQTSIIIEKRDQNTGEEAASQCCDNDVPKQLDDSIKINEEPKEINPNFEDFGDVSEYLLPPPPPLPPPVPSKGVNILSNDGMYKDMTNNLMPSYATLLFTLPFIQENLMKNCLGFL